MHLKYQMLCEHLYILLDRKQITILLTSVKTIAQTLSPLHICIAENSFFFNANNVNKMFNIFDYIT